MRGYKPDQIVIMSRLARYDKNQRAEDEKILKYYRHDYIYNENMKTRIAVLIGLMIVFMLYVINGLANGTFDLASLNFIEDNGDIIKILLTAVIVLVIYTVASTIKSTKEYQDAAKRMTAYVRTLDILEERRRLEEMPIDEWDNRDLAATRVLPKREVSNE